MTDDTPAAKPSSKTPPSRKPAIPRSLGKAARDVGPYALALAIFAVTAEFTLNSTAAHYADELFTLALVLIRTGGHAPPPSKP